MDITQFLILSLATWRISSLLVNEAGPWDIFERLRSLVGVRYDDYSIKYAKNNLAELFMCVWCMSLWVGALWVTMFLVTELAVLLAIPFALSTMTIVVDSFANKE